MTAYSTIGIVAGILGLVACSIYVWAILKKQTRPDRVTWWVMAIITILIAASYAASGALETLWLPVAYAVSFTLVAILSVRYGEGPFYLHTLDRVCLAGAAIGALLWWLSGDPFIALLANIITEFIALTPTIVKAYKRPETESSAAWTVTTVASVANMFAIGDWSLAIALYPIYAFATNLLIAVFLLRRP